MLLLAGQTPEASLHYNFHIRWTTNREGQTFSTCRNQGATAGWTGLSNAVMETAREVCGESRGQRHRERQTWLWCEEVQQVIKREGRCI